MAPSWEAVVVAPLEAYRLTDAWILLAAAAAGLEQGEEQLWELTPAVLAEDHLTAHL
jgi:hypothetical protein